MIGFADGEIAFADKYPGFGIAGENFDFRMAAVFTSRNNGISGMTKPTRGTVNDGAPMKDCPRSTEGTGAHFQT